jgi:hypothetical protein
MPSVRRLAIPAINPDQLAEFYCEIFEMKKVGRSPNDG